MRSFLKGVVFLSVVCLCGPSFAEICDGRYSKAKALIDKTYSIYGTLYSGGRRLEGIGGTLDIYRMLSGLPDAGFSTGSDLEDNLEFVDNSIYLPGNSDDPKDKEKHLTQVGQALKRNLLRLQDPEFRRFVGNKKTDPEVILDIYSSIGPHLGWWLDQTDSQLSDIERVIGSFRNYDGMDWILTVLSASANGVRANWGVRIYDYTIEGRGYQSLYYHSLRQFNLKEDLPWFVAAHLNMDRYSGGPYDILQPKDIDTEKLSRAYKSLMDKVKACTARDGEYAAYVIALYERTRLEVETFGDKENFTGHDGKVLDKELMVMPDVLRNMAAVHFAKKKADKPAWHGSNKLSDEQVIKLATNPQFTSWFNFFRSVRSRSVDELIDVNSKVPLNPKTLRMLNLLSVDDLVRFSNARTEFPLEQRVIYTAAFSRMFVLGREKEARQMVPDLAKLWPKYSERILAVWKNGETAGYRLAKIIKLLPTPRTLIVPISNWRGENDDKTDMFDNNMQWDRPLYIWSEFRRSWDMPFDMRLGKFLDRDVGVWMQTSGAAPDAGYRAQSRALYRGAGNLQLAQVDWHSPRDEGHFHYLKQGILSYAAWNEVQTLSPQTGLANKISRELILNAQRKSISAWRRLWLDNDAVAGDLRYVVDLSRRMISGKMDGKPVGQVAFQLLHRRFGETEAAKKTRYWYVCKERCER